jgi:hypothetical protein
MVIPMMTRLKKLERMAPAPIIFLFLLPNTNYTSLIPFISLDFLAAD